MEVNNSFHSLADAIGQLATPVAATDVNQKRYVHLSESGGLTVNSSNKNKLNLIETTEKIRFVITESAAKDARVEDLVNMERGLKAFKSRIDERMHSSWNQFVIKLCSLFGIEHAGLQSLRKIDGLIGIVHNSLVAKQSAGSGMLLATESRQQEIERMQENLRNITYEAEIAQDPLQNITYEKQGAAKIEQLERDIIMGRNELDKQRAVIEAIKERHEAAHKEPNSEYFLTHLKTSLGGDPAVRYAARDSLKEIVKRETEEIDNEKSKLLHLERNIVRNEALLKKLKESFLPKDEVR